jgi:hypothetical protein
MRKLASIRRIADIQPILDADAIEVAVVDGWKVVVKKGEYNVGDLAVYLEIFPQSAAQRRVPPHCSQPLPLVWQKNRMLAAHSRVESSVFGLRPVFRAFPFPTHLFSVNLPPISWQKPQ